MIEIVSGLFKAIIGFILAILFIFIPASTTDIEQQIAWAEEDLALTIPDTYVVLSSNSDWLGFDETQEFVLQFEDEAFEQLLMEIEQNSEIETGVWTESDFGYEFKSNSSQESKFYVTASIDREQKTLRYKYSGL